MKNNRFFLATLLAGCFAFSAKAQTKEARASVATSTNQTALMALQNQFQAQYEADSKAVEAYLARNPSKKRSFEKDGSKYIMQRIDKNGEPVYINFKSIKHTNKVADIKNRESGKLIKTDQLYSGGSLGVNITGKGMVVGVWDGGLVRTTHELLVGSATMEANQSTVGDDHQTHVTGTIVGKEIANQPSARGIAYEATARGWDSPNDKAEMVGFAAEGYLISNHSYGYSNKAPDTKEWTLGAYDTDSKNWDIITKNAPYYLPFNAAGNEQDGATNVATKKGYDIISGNSSAKNVLTIGAVNGDKTMSDYSNWGPTDDGRVKPEIVAKGTGINSSQFFDKDKNPSDNAYSGTEDSQGTSYASPAAAGAGLLLQQYYKSVHGAYMRASTLKALLLGTAEDLGQKGPDPKFGWGLLNAEKAGFAIKNRSTADALKGSVIEEIATNPANDATDEITRTVKASGCEPLIISLAWTDDEGAEQTEEEGNDPTKSRMVYDFDMLAKNTTDNSETRTWKPVTMANRTEDATISKTWFDATPDVYKQIKIEKPVAGQEYKISIRKSASSPAAARLLSLVITGTSTGIAPPTLRGATAKLEETASLTATCAVGIPTWYANETGGTSLGSGTFTTPALTGNTTYYVACEKDGCGSVRENQIVRMHLFRIAVPEEEKAGLVKNTDVMDWSDSANVLGKNAENSSKITANVYPIPSTNLCHWKLQSDANAEVNVTLLNLQGQERFNQVAKGNEGIIDLSNLEAGIYLLKIKVEGKVITRKIIKD